MFGYLTEVWCHVYNKSTPFKFTISFEVGPGDGKVFAKTQIWIEKVLSANDFKNKYWNEDRVYQMCVLFLFADANEDVSLQNHHGVFNKQKAFLILHPINMISKKESGFPVQTVVLFLNAELPSIFQKITCKCIDCTLFLINTVSHFDSKKSLLILSNAIADWFEYGRIRQLQITLLINEIWASQCNAMSRIICANDEEKC